MSSPTGRTRRIAIFLIWALYLLGLAEVSGRVFLRATYSVPFLRPQDLLYEIYPRLKEVRSAQIRRGDETFDVLLLGASALTSEWGSIEEELERALADRNVRIHNLSKPAHTSLDSFYKYRYLDDKQFDLVLFYHGINETRMNNVAKERFRDDYSHYSWYAVLNIFEAHRNFPYFAAPYAARLMVLELKRKAGLPGAESIDVASLELPELRRLGAEIKTAPIFFRNLSEIIALARRRGDPLAIGTFAFHVPPDYSLERFKAKELSYAAHKSPIEIWGAVENVIKGLEAHNEMIRRAAAESPDVLLVDFERLMLDGAGQFDDICHFTATGSRHFVELFLETLRAAGRLPKIPPESAATE